jgi:outer membrane receptor protein involved in Fe transport
MSTQGRVSPSRGARIFLPLAAALVWSSSSLAAEASAPTTDDAFSFVNEEQLVTGAAKRDQPLSETPSAVSVLTSSEIRAMGYRTLGEALQWVRGLYVTNDRNYSYLGIRGLLRPGDYNVRVLLTIDGHAMNGAIYGDAAFGAEGGIDMETIERIEVVRGPGSALYGSNAVLAVVNVVTRRPRRDDGVVLSARAGGPGDRRLFLSAGTARPGRPAARIDASWTRTRGADLYFPEFDAPESNFGRAVDADGEDAVNLYGTAEWSGFRLAAKWNERMKRIPTGAFGVRFNDRDSRTFDGHNFVELSTLRSLGTGLGLAARGYWDGAPYRGEYVFGPDSARLVNVDEADSDLVGAEARVHWSPWTRHVVTIGAEERVHLRERQLNYDREPHVVYVDVRDRNDVHTGLFAQTESRLGAGVRATVGVRCDRLAESGSAWSPRADVVWQASPNTTFRVLGGSAFRAPTEFERDYEGESYVAHPDLSPERATTWEIGADHRLGWVRLRADVFHTRIRHLIDLVAPDSATLQYANGDAVRMVGAGVECEYVGATGRRARWSLAVQRSEVAGGGEELTGSPHVNTQLLVIEPIRPRRLTAALGLRYGSTVRTLAGARTTSGVVADGRIGWTPRPGLELGLEGRNLFDVRHTAAASTEFSIDQVDQPGRYAAVTVTFLPAVLR